MPPVEVSGWRRSAGRAAVAGFAGAVLALQHSPATAETGYKYRDANGQWVFTDRAPGPGTTSESFNLKHETAQMRLVIARYDDARSTQLIAVNECLCVASFQLSISESRDLELRVGAQFEATLQPQSRQILLKIPRSATDQPDIRYTGKAAIGPPGAVHSPVRPYRVPFAAGSTFLISQAYPSQTTHTTRDSIYAVDIAVPDGTPIYAAREGGVIDARHDSFHGGATPVMLDQANVVAILHDDGTIAIYGHLHWDSLRVRIGDRVVRGQYIANSGNTGFTSGPHLHFAVIRNAGFEDVSVPIQFAGLADAPVTPANQMLLTAY